MTADPVVVTYFPWEDVCVSREFDIAPKGAVTIEILGPAIWEDPMSPFKSERQRRFLHAQEPEVAEKFEKEAKKKGVAPVQPKKKATKKKAKK